MERARIGQRDLEYEVVGTGEPAVFIHGSFIADTFRPLLGEPALADRYQLIRYRRRGYGDSVAGTGPGSVDEQAADCGELLRHIGSEHAHVVGHSYGGCVALQFALNEPGLVRSLVLLEPALAVGDSAGDYRQALAQGIQRYRQVGAAAVLPDMLQARWPGYEDTLEQVLPGAFEQAVADGDASFETDLAGLLEWRFDETDARQLAQPALVVIGEASDSLWPRFGDTHRRLLAWLPRAEGFTLPGATHFMQLESPSRSRSLAEALAGFFGRHEF